MSNQKKALKKEAGIFSNFMTIIGVVTVGGILIAFFNAAPELSQSEAHTTAVVPKDCYQCHMIKIENAPIMPHRPMEYCGFCHHKAESKTE
jgi:hypothetical protein